MRRADRITLARDIIRREVAAAGGVVAGVDAAFGRLRREVSAVVGGAGFEALLARALRADPSPDPDGFSENAAAVLARVVGLLASLLGDELAARLVRRVWPHVRAGRRLRPDRFVSSRRRSGAVVSSPPPDRERR